MRLGVKASRKDIDVMMELEPYPFFVETFLGPQDLMGDLEELAQVFEAPGEPVVIHVPEFVGDIFIDLASSDPKVWQASFVAVARCVKLAELVHSPRIVLHPGGATDKAIDRSAAIKRLRASIQELSYEKFYLENMPWFYFQAREKRVRSHIMVDVTDFEEVLDVIGGITVDTCHGYLSTEGGSMDYLLALMDSYPGVPKYYHISDALPPDKEGLQIGEGAIDFEPVFERLRQQGDDVWGIPEIMGGHAGKGAGFAKALNTLRSNGL
jgi:N-acetylneuraminate synthase